MDRPSVASIIESILFVSPTPVTLDKLTQLLEEFDRGEIKRALEYLHKEYAGPERGIILELVAGGYQFRTSTINADYIRRLTKNKPFRFSQSALETLAIIAYRQPVTRAEVESMRGVDSGGVIKTLLDRKLIKMLGKKDIPGKPIIYGTTREFLEMFSLKDLASLPTLKEVQDLNQPTLYETQEELPLHDES